ncbi:diacylglycerol kinase family enzyme [Algoriphagus sp. 4150]|uniref:diacylglycerol/lipid kinase family protein n=1 Tax=Algoriphagus sp. 4150 TaxID=2817756 RepID=UPI00285E2618|nr:diacylglycerol kinase family protein [Algoriphagus sp. 4150]MDR7131338.1 diacylglycerol kinase family enzyme [Algoriphagus sp. 4150]
MAKKCLLIYNPISGNDSISGIELLEMAETRLPNFRVKLWETTGENDEDKILTKYKQFSPDLVLIGGGDGTVKLVAKCLKEVAVPMCVLPLGSANGLAKCMGINDLTDSWESVRDYDIHPIDAIHINNELCLHLADFGINANLVQKFEQEESRGMLGYVKNSLSEIFGTEAMNFRLKIAEESVKIKAKMIVIANGDRYGTGAIVNCKGVMDDGKFEIIAFNPETAEDYVRMTMAFIRGNLDQVEGVQTWVVEECQLDNLEGAEFQIDGEIMEPIESITAKIEKHAFRFLVGKSFTTCHTSPD